LLPFDRAPYALVTIHPSAVLRMPTDDDRHAAMVGFVEDLRVVAEALKKEPK
jgi:uracil-DNA glycosylase